MDFKVQELWNPLRQYLLNCTGLVGNCLQDRANFHRSRSSQIVRISITVNILAYVTWLAVCLRSVIKRQIVRYTKRHMVNVNWVLIIKELNALVWTLYQQLSMWWEPNPTDEAYPLVPLLTVQWKHYHAYAAVLTVNEPIIVSLWRNWPISRIPQYTCSTSHYAPFRTEMSTFLFSSEWCIVGYGTGALWDLWD